MFIKIADEPAKGFVPELGITTLEEYYNWLPELKSITVEEEGIMVTKPTKFTVLPLDEEHFNINANTRAINIPADFKKNGVAVQGDDLAEVVYFKINRYFDAVDLNNCDIYIQWEAPKDANGEIKKGISDTYIRDIESEPGFLIFGWAISEAITNTSGNLKFSVKFLQRDKESKKIVYSLNTLTAQVAIHPSIGIKVDDYKADNANDRLLQRIQESVVVGGLEAAIPVFVENLDGSIEYDIDNHYDGSLKIYAVAKSSDTGAISYVWKKRELTEDNQIEDTDIFLGNSKLEDVPVEKDAEGYPILIPGHTYVYGDKRSVWNKVEGTTKDDFIQAFGSNVEAIPTFYETKAVLEVKDAGVYTVEAKNRIFNSISVTPSEPAMFKRPDPIAIDNSKESSFGHIIGETSANLQPPHDEKAIGELTYQWYKAAESNLLSEDFKFLDLPTGGVVSYTESSARILCPTDPSVYHEQKVGEGGSTDRFYITMRCYAPEGATKLRMNGVNTLQPTTPDPVIDDTLEIETLKNKAGYGVEKDKEYFNFWIHIAGYSNNAWKAWSTGKGEGEFIGYRYIIEWYDDNMNVIDTTFARIELANENNFNAMENFQEIETGTEKAYVASDEGLYMVKITRTRNTRTISENSIEYRVTEAPKVPDMSKNYQGAKLVSVTDLMEGNDVLSVEMGESIKFDEYEVTWKLWRGDKKKEDLVIYKEFISNRISEFNPTDEIFASIFEQNNEDIEGRYYAIVSTKRNGVSSEATTVPDPDKMFVVTGV